jgi:hypothetical protein
MKTCAVPRLAITLVSLTIALTTPAAAQDRVALVEKFTRNCQNGVLSHPEQTAAMIGLHIPAQSACHCFASLVVGMLSPAQVAQAVSGGTPQPPADRTEAAWKYCIATMAQF